MAQIPVYQRQKQIPSSVAVPKDPGATSPLAFGAGKARALEQIGQAVSGVGNVMVQHGIKMKQREDEANARTAFIHQSEQVAAYKSEVFDLKGKNALGITKNAKEDYQKLTTSTIDQFKLTGESERIFRRMADSQYLSDQQVISRYEGSERRKWEAQTSSDFLRTQSKNLSSDVKGLSLEEIEGRFNKDIAPAVKDFSKHSREGEKEIIAKEKAFTYADTIQQAIITGDITRAKDALKRWRKDLNPDTRKALETNIRNKELQIDSETKALEYMGMGLGKKETIDKIRKDLSGEKNYDIRNYTIRKYKALQSDKDASERQAYVDNTFEYMNNIENIHREKGISAAQNYLRSIPKTSKLQRKIYSQVESLYARLARGYGIDRQSDADRYLWLSDKIQEGKINNEKELFVASEGMLTKSDLKELGMQLNKSQNVPDKQLKQVYANALGQDGFKLLNKRQKKGWYAFAVWAKDLLKDSNKAKDPKYVQELANLYHLEGEREVMIPYPGYGVDEPFYKSMMDKNWIVDSPDSDAKNSLALKPKDIPDIVAFMKKAKTYGSYMEKADGNEEIAARMAWTDTLRERYITGTTEKQMFELAQKYMNPKELVKWSRLPRQAKEQEIKRIAGL